MDCAEARVSRYRIRDGRVVQRLVRRRARAGLLIAAGLLTLFLVACDPTEDALKIRLVNDTGEAFELKKCRGETSTCAHASEDVSINPGRAYSTNVDGTGGIQWFKVLHQDGSVFGCLRVQFEKPIEGIAFNLSSSTTCPSLNKTYISSTAWLLMTASETLGLTLQAAAAGAVSR